MGVQPKDFSKNFKWFNDPLSLIDDSTKFDFQLAIVCTGNGENDFRNWDKFKKNEMWAFNIIEAVVSKSGTLKNFASQHETNDANAEIYL